MNLLKRKRELRRFRKQPPVNPNEIYDELQSFAKSIGFTLAENEIRFPQPLCFEQLALLMSAYCENLYRETVPFADIIGMKSNGDRIRILLRTGHEFSFVKDRPLWMVHNLLNYGEPFFLTVWGWKLSGWWEKVTCQHSVRPKE